MKNIGILTALTIVAAIAVPAMADDAPPYRQQDRMRAAIELDQRGDRIEARLDRKGDRINAQLDRRGDRIDRQLDLRAERMERGWHKRGHRPHAGRGEHYAWRCDGPRSDYRCR